MYTANIDNAKSISLSQDERGFIISVNNQKASASISLFGGHVLSYINKSDGQERLWLSDNAVFNQKTPIRGGIPICWPWFGNLSEQNERDFALQDQGNIKRPSHGFLRNQHWRLLDVTEKQDNGGVISTSVCLEPESINAYGFNVKVQPKLYVSVGENLTVRLVSHNLSDSPVMLGQALHTYFAIPNIEEVYIEGIHADFEDKLTSLYKQKTPKPYIINSEVDRIHDQNTESQILIKRRETHDIISRFYQRGQDSLVVWNPWIEKSSTMVDMSEHAYKGMLCIEAANIKGVNILPSKTHTLEQCIF